MTETNNSVETNEEIQTLLNQHNKQQLAEMVLHERELKTKAHGKNREYGKQIKELEELVKQQETVLQNNEKYVHEITKQVDYKDFLLNQSEQKQKSIVEEVARVYSTIENIVSMGRKATSQEISRPFERYIGSPQEEENE